MSLSDNMSRQKELLFSTCLLACLTAGLTLALPPGAATPWSNFASKSVYSRALGPPKMDTISVPYMPKSPFFPKFVDPKTMISKKTDMLSTLFGGLGPVQYNMADTKPVIPYGASGLPLDSADSANPLYSIKRDASSPDDKVRSIDSSDIYKRSMLGPFAKFGPMGPKFGPMSPFSSPFSQFSSPDAMQTPFSRRRRSVEATDDSSVPGPQIMESMSATKADGAPKEYLPGTFKPFGPFGPMMDPSIFMSKKSAFLDTLFKNLATSTPATTTDAPAPKSTIVPPSFWIPSSVIPGPDEYTSKVSDFLDKLFDGLKLNETSDADDGAAFMRSLKPEDTSADKIARSLDDAPSIAAAKDAIVDTIMSELGDLKGDMIATLNDLIAYEKAAAAAAATSKKPFKPSPFSGFPFAKPTLDPTLPFKQRMAVLSQVFDMLTNLQKNITIAAKSATVSSSNADTSSNSESPLAAGSAIGASPINNTLLSAILKKISAIDTATSVPYPINPVKENPIANRALPREPTSIWVSYPENPTSAVKRQADLSPFLGYENENDDHQHDRGPYTRGVKMQMHQGYQSLPAGSVESVQAGGGSTPGHQGGGIKLLGPNGDLNKWADWVQYHKSDYQDHRHHHNHH